MRSQKKKKINYYVLMWSIPTDCYVKPLYIRLIKEISGIYLKINYSKKERNIANN